MPQTPEQFRDLMMQVLAGSQTAVEELLRRYEPNLLQAVRKRLHKKMRSKFDSFDFTQDVWASFFADLPRYGRFDNPDDLAAYLTRVARNKVIDAVRQRLKLQKHNVGREQSLDDSRRLIKEELTGLDPTPSQIVVTEEQWQGFLDKQPLVYRRILILLREGETVEAIAEELGISTRTVRRVARRMTSGCTS